MFIVLLCYATHCYVAVVPTIEMALERADYLLSGIEYERITAPTTPKHYNFVALNVTGYVRPIAENVNLCIEWDHPI